MYSWHILVARRLMSAHCSLGVNAANKLTGDPGSILVFSPCRHQVINPAGLQLILISFSAKFFENLETFNIQLSKLKRQVKVWLLIEQKKCALC